MAGGTASDTDTKPRGWRSWPFEKRVTIFSVVVLLIAAGFGIVFSLPSQRTAHDAPQTGPEIYTPTAAPLTTTPAFVPTTDAERFAVTAIENRWDVALPASSFVAGKPLAQQLVTYIQTECDRLTREPAIAMNRIADAVNDKPSSGGDGVLFRPQFVKLIEGGFPLMCPQHADAVTKARAGDYPRVIKPGRYIVGKEVVPGTYVATGKMTDCYWERVAKDGQIIDNALSSVADKLTVTIAAGDGGFFTERCAPWIQQR